MSSPCFYPYGLCPFRVFFHWFEERVEINLCILGTGFQRAGSISYVQVLSLAAVCFSLKTDLYHGPK